MKILIFGGTTEGRELADLLSANNHAVVLSVATEYGKTIAEEYGESISAGYENNIVADSENNYANDNRNLNIIAKRQDEEEITAMLNSGGYDFVIDATHPYADLVTKNIKSACMNTETEYLRLSRCESNRKDSIIYVDNAKQAAELLNDVPGNVLLTTGSKDLDIYTSVNDFANRIFVRIIPMQESIQKAIDLGYKNANIICMQGPFEEDMNIATIKMTNAKYMITKDSGETGGFSQKLVAAEKAGCKTIVITRPNTEIDFENVFTFDEIINKFGIDNKTIETKVEEEHEDESDSLRFFPLFANLRNKRIVVVGGGKISQRRIEKLLPYGANIIVISPSVTDAIQQEIDADNADNSEANNSDNKEVNSAGNSKNKAYHNIEYIKKKYEKSDIKNAFLVIACTDDRDVNHMIMEDSKGIGSLVVVADSRDDCDCWIPAIAENEEYIAGIVSKNGNHSELREKAKELRRFLNNE